MRHLAAITMLILALAIIQPVEAQSFKPDWIAGNRAYYQKDYATALRHWRPLAKQGHPNAQLNIGRMYNDGKGVGRDRKQAVKWSRKAAKQAHPTAQQRLGKMYRDGDGVLQDLVMAYAWFNIAATSYPSHLKNYASSPRDKVLSRLTASERRLALKLSKLCLKKPAKCPEYSDD